mmetsp:Transcript_40582/g.67390  ORF Transcript_40582/g.67390 Transcript_40582/m.67390 type:complete len:196 (+) Transcript_40582:52-639(+)|eukprot:CAMPEP_0119321854 /NCGR_PEP_ID=MMETSP1333-20130426/56616_1 /TAXON_ID=418940 /ORGANISM="Scyphosphaera apsteinii, Strain RCC1455" /LENGTH=195 /DNA_ID=CAMNT_0007328931 /DNA_START=46 /DNA_END=633 /DNA_ORIENTATION=+
MEFEPLSMEAQLALSQLQHMDNIEGLLAAVLRYIAGEMLDAAVFKQLQASTSLDSATLGGVFTGLHWIIRACLRSSLKLKAIRAELAELRIPSPCAESILAAVEEGRAAMRSTEQPSCSALPTLETLRWRLDVAIATGQLSKVLRPQLTLQCTLSDQSSQTFHVSKQRFDELRYTVANLLKGVQDLESRMPAVDS